MFFIMYYWLMLAKLLLKVSLLSLNQDIQRPVCDCLSLSHCVVNQFTSEAVHTRKYFTHSEDF